MKEILLVVTLLPNSGHCGVQTHFNHIIDYTRQEGVSTKLIEPRQLSIWFTRLPLAFSRYLKYINPELSAIVQRYFLYIFLLIRLRHEITMSNFENVTVYAQDPLSAKAALSMRKFGFNFRLVLICHFNESEAYEFILSGVTKKDGLLYRSLMSLEDEVLPKVDSVIFVSDYMRKVVLARYKNLINNHIVLPIFLKKNQTINENIKITGDIISIGTLEQRKNQGYLIQVLAKAKALGYIYKLTLVGDGPMRSEWEDLADKLGVAKQVNFLGYVNISSNLFLGHRLYAHTSVMESFGIVLIEAMSQGLPVLAPKVGGIPEVFEDGVQGKLWPLDNTFKCANLLIELLENKDLLKTFSEACLQHYNNKYEVSKLAPRWIKAIL